jgi:hypothetical protein
VRLVTAPLAHSDGAASTTVTDRIARARRAFGWPEVVVATVVVAALARPLVADTLDAPALRNWATVFQAVFLQALPFLVLGVVLSGAVAALVPAALFERLASLPAAAAVPSAAACGVILPGCECGSVPLAGRLVSRGLHESAALAFLLASPAINPVVLVATAVAFPGRPEVVVARTIASLLAASVTGWIWLRVGRPEWLQIERYQRNDEHRVAAFARAAVHDFTHAGGYLVIGAVTAGLLQTVVPRSVLDGLAGNVIVATASLAVLAVVLSICSEADAFVAAGLTRFPITSRLAFLVVGPMVDVKLVAMQIGTFGKAFALRFAPLTFVCAVASAVVVGAVLL